MRERVHSRNGSIRSGITAWWVAFAANQSVRPINISFTGKKPGSIFQKKRLHGILETAAPQPGSRFKKSEESWIKAFKI